MKGLGRRFAGLEFDQERVPAWIALNFSWRYTANDF